jgi:cytochrome c oxidase cbb3-type subunit III
VLLVPAANLETIQRPLVRRRVCLAVWLWLLSAAGCDFPGKPNLADQPVPPEKVLEFSTLFQQNCSGCHGANGEFGPAPPLNSRLFRAIVPESEIERVVSDGRHGTPMAPFARSSGGSLTAAQVKVLVSEIKGMRYTTIVDSASGETKVEAASASQAMAPSWGVPEAAPANAPPYFAGESKLPRTSEAYEQIRTTTFTRACAGCHGSRGQGGEKAGAINNPALLSLVSDQLLRRLVITGRADLGMPDYTGTRGRSPDFQPLNSEEIADLVGLLGYWRRASSTTDAGKQSLDATSSFRGPNQKRDRDGKSS